MTGEALLNAALLGGLYAAIALGLSIVFGIMRLVNLAHGMFVVAGAYLTLVVASRVPLDPLLLLLVVGPVLFGLAYLVQRYVLQRLLPRGAEPPLVATFGLLLLGEGVLTFLFGGQARSLDTSYATAGLEVLGMRIRTVYLIAFVLAVLMVAATHYVLTRTRFGSALRASAADAPTASLMGIDVARMHAVTFGAAAVFAAVAGVLFGTAFSITPGSGLPLLVLGFTVVVLGGVGSVTGTLVGGIVVGLVESVGGAAFGATYAQMTVYVLLLAVLVIRPTGLFGARRIA